LVRRVLYISHMKQDYCLIRSTDLERINDLVRDALDSAAVEAFPPSTTSHQCAMTYASAYGRTYAALGIIQDTLMFATPYDPSVERTPF